MSEHTSAALWVQRDFFRVTYRQPVLTTSPTGADDA